MKAEFRKSFERDLKRLKNDPRTRGRVREAIEEVEAVGGLQALPSVRKLSGGSGEYYRLRVGDYRIGPEFWRVRSPSSCGVSIGARSTATFPE